MQLVRPHKDQRSGGLFFQECCLKRVSKSVEEIAETSAEDILERVIEVNSVKKYTRVMLDKKDIQLCIDFAVLIARKRRLLSQAP